MEKAYTVSHIKYTVYFDSEAVAACELSSPRANGSRVWNGAALNYTAADKCFKMFKAVCILYKYKCLKWAKMKIDSCLSCSPVWMKCMVWEVCFRYLIAVMKVLLALKVAWPCVCVCARAHACVHAFVLVVYLQSCYYTRYDWRMCGSMQNHRFL